MINLDLLGDIPNAADLEDEMDDKLVFSDIISLGKGKRKKLELDHLLLPPTLIPEF